MADVVIAMAKTMQYIRLASSTSATHIRRLRVTFWHDTSVCKGLTFSS